jgi:hypothetical protein
MATLREHLKKFHKTQADHQRSREADHSALEECFGKLASLSKAAKSEMKDKDGESLSEHLQKIAAVHGSLAQHAGSCADDHDAAVEDCSKITADELGKAASPDDLAKRVTALENTMVPTNVHAITPNVPGVTAVPRSGQRAFAEKPVVATQFSKLVEIED